MSKDSIPPFDHSYYMKKALMQARVALRKNEVPIGAIVVDGSGNIIGRGHNVTESSGCQTGHAEMRAIFQACKARGNWRLDDCIVYVTLEPCIMCFGLCTLSRLKGIVYGGTSPLFGSRLDKEDHFPLYKKDLFFVGGIHEAACVGLLKEFFKQRRNERCKDDEAARNVSQ